MNILLLASHSVAEYDDIRMFTDLGYDVFCPGGYQDPSAPGESLRPALPDAPYHPDLVAACEEVRREKGDPGPYIDWAKAAVHPAIIDWADVIIVHHFPRQWIAHQWERLAHKRVIWRTCGQSDPSLERDMAWPRARGMQIVRYSPAEQRAFGDDFAGQDALIRFGKYPKDYGPWKGGWVTVGNITQDMANRGDAVGLDRWKANTEGLSTTPAGPGSKALHGGMGPLSYPEMLDYLRNIRAYLYTGTMPASYTLGLIEAMLSGVPVVPVAWKAPGQPWLNELWEANTIVPRHDEDPAYGCDRLKALLDDRDFAWERGEEGRQRAVELFGIDTIGAQWKAFLG